MDVTSFAAPEVVALRAEHRRDALGIGAARPRLTWRIETGRPGWWQADAEVECSGAARRVETAPIDGDESSLVAWPFAPLSSRDQVEVRVRVRGTDGSASDWSAPLAVEAGLLDVADWSAAFVSPPAVPAIGECPAWELRRAFTVRHGLASARLYISALGVYEASINGSVVGDEVLAPGWTTYDARLRYATHDVTALLQEGENLARATVADGWYRGRIGFNGGRWNIWGDRTALLAQLELTYDDGTAERVVTDGAWEAARSAVTAASLYDGETVDARIEPAGWAPVHVLDRDLSTLIAPVGPPVRRTQELAPVAITTSPAGRTLVDFGQNLVGWLRITVDGEAGQTVTLRHAEVLEHGELGTRPLRTAKATDTYTLRGGGPETYEPRFTVHGFRFAEVEGWPSELAPADITAIVVHSDMERTGWFACSDPLVSRLHENVVWGLRGNFVDVPTDCPQRDERLGWTGDLQVFAPTASFIYDTAGFLASWLADLAAEQAKTGGVVPMVVPNALGMEGGAAAWADAATVVPSVVMERMGDRGLLATQFESMASWVDAEAAAAGPTRIAGSGFQFGDWLDPTAAPDQPWNARTDKAIVATAYFAHSAELTARAAGLLGRSADEARYAALAAEMRDAFAREFITPAGRMMCDAETAYALAIVFDLLPTPEQRRRAGDRLAELVRDARYTIRTGFVGTPLICDALSATGHHGAAYRLLTQTHCPSWLYAVTMGATTIWERWDSILPDGSVNPGEMNSLNHYALGAVADWMHRTVGGIAPATPGYRVVAVAPRPGGGITSATARHRTPYGDVCADWRIEGDTFTLGVEVPPNARAIVTVPGCVPVEVGSGRHAWTVPYTDPDRRGPWTLDDVAGEVFADPVAAAALMAVIREHPGAGLLPMILPNEPGLSLRTAITMASDSEAFGERLLAALNGKGSS